MTNWVLASDGHPFRDRDAAQIKCDLLRNDLGEAAANLEVLAHPRGGYGVRVRYCQSLAASAVPPSPREALSDELQRPPQGASAASSVSSRNTLRVARFIPPFTKVVTPAARSYPEAFRLSPAIRAFVGLHVQALLGAVLLFSPHLVFVITGLGLPTSRAGAVTLALVAGCGALLALISLTRFLWAYTANTYVVDPHGVEQIQWYFDKGRLRRRAPRVNFGHLRSADVDQSILQMLLNVGCLKLASGATDSYELVLRHVTSPRVLQREFQRRLRLQQASASGQPARAADL